jgi:hypothetical protein
MQHVQCWQEVEYVYLMRPQMLVQVPVKQEVLGDLVAVWHPGFFDKSRNKFTYEWRHQSAACIAAHEGRVYVTCAWYGGKTEVFSAALARLVEMEQQDQRQGIKKQRYENGWILQLDGECGISAELRAYRNGDHFGGGDVAFRGEKNPRVGARDR